MYILQQGDYVPDYNMTFGVDTVAEVAQIDINGVPAGSFVLVRENSAVYMLGDDKQWKEL